MLNVTMLIAVMLSVVAPKHEDWAERSIIFFTSNEKLTSGVNVIKQILFAAEGWTK
jgi:hypothetical protein